MTNKNLFKQAHALTRSTIQAGDDYRATFGLCLRSLLIEKRMADAVYMAINYQAPVKPRKPRITKQAIATALPFTGFFIIVCLFMALFVGGISAISAMSDRNKESFAKLYADDTAQVVETNDSLDDMFNDIQVAIDDSGVDGITIVKKGAL